MLHYAALAGKSDVIDILMTQGAVCFFFFFFFLALPTLLFFFSNFYVCRLLMWKMRVNRPLFIMLVLREERELLSYFV